MERCDEGDDDGDDDGDNDDDDDGDDGYVDDDDDGDDDFRQFGLRRTIPPFKFSTRSSTESQRPKATRTTPATNLTKQCETRPHDHAKARNHVRKTELSTCTIWLYKLRTG